MFFLCLCTSINPLIGALAAPYAPPMPIRVSPMGRLVGVCISPCALACSAYAYPHARSQVCHRVHEPPRPRRLRHAAVVRALRARELWDVWELVPDAGVCRVRCGFMCVCVRVCVRVLFVARSRVGVSVSVRVVRVWVLCERACVRGLCINHPAHRARVRAPPDGDCVRACVRGLCINHPARRARVCSSA